LAPDADLYKTFHKHKIMLQYTVKGQFVSYLLLVRESNNIIYGRQKKLDNDRPIDKCVVIDQSLFGIRLFVLSQ